MNDPPRRPLPLAAAMEWVAKITTVAIEMVLPAIGGHLLDRRLGTGYWVLAGLVLGFTVGFWHLMRMTRVKAKRSPGADGRSGGGPAEG